MADASAVPAHEEIKEILKAFGAPPYITLDIGGSEDLDGDGSVRASLGPDGELIFEDA